MFIESKKKKMKEQRKEEERKEMGFEIKTKWD